MKREISGIVEKMKPSGIRAFFDLVLGMKDVISLGVGEPDFVTPWQIREAGITSLEQGFTSYTSNKGLYKLRLSIAQYMKNRYGLVYSPDDEILITVGVSEAKDLAMRTILNPGDKVLVCSPSYVSYGPLVELAGGKPVYIDTRSSGFKLSPKALGKAIDKKTKALILNYPSNPTGVSYIRKELSEINRVLLKRNILCVSDEIYGDLSYDFEHTPFPVLSGAKENCIYLNGFSKSYAMTGWRVGYACGPKDIIAGMTKIHQYTIMCVPITSQMAAAEAIHTGRKSVEEMKREYKRRREFMCDGLTKLRLDYVMPQGAFYFFVSVKNTGMSSLKFAERLLKEEKVALVPGTAFGESFDDYVRISYASSYENLKESLIRIGSFLNRRKGRG